MWSQNEAGRKFCGECGNPLALGCASCGAANAASAKFCGECGASLTGQPAVRLATTPSAIAGRRAPTRHGPLRRPRRLYNALRVARRRGGARTAVALLRHLPATDRTLRRDGGEIHRRRGDGGLGNTSGDEDDAERAVRAALDLVASVSALGDEVGASDLRARAGVLTGEAA